MSNGTQVTFGAWLDASVRNAASRPAAARLATAFGSPANGDGALLVFSMARSAFPAVDTTLDSPVEQWTKLAATIARDGLLVGAAHSQIQESTKRDRGMKVWGPMLRMADLHARGELKPGCLTAIGLVMTHGIVSNTALSKKVADQLSAMVGACVRGSGHEYAHEWLKFSQTNLLDADVLQQVVDGGAPEQIRSLAGALRRAVEGLPAVPAPASIVVAQEAVAPPIFGRQEPPEPLAAPALDPEHAHHELKLVASVIGVSKVASFAGTAEVFGVPNTWNRYAPHRLAKVTEAAGEALAPGRLGLTRGFALLSLMALVVSHDHRPSLRLRIGLRPGDVPDLWYCPRARCVFANRRLLLRLKKDDGTLDLIPLFVPGDAAEEIEQLLRQRPEVRDLTELLGIGNMDEWLSLAESWLSGLGDPAHKSRSARVSHALALVYRLVGATEAEAALLTLNLAVAPDGALHYLAIVPARAYELACRAFDFLKLKRPAPPPEGMRIGSRDVPSLDQMRDDWEGLNHDACNGLRTLRTADTLDLLRTSFNQVMVAGRRAYESLKGDRHESMAMPRVVDLLGSDRETYTDDKKTQPSSARLMAMTPELRHVVAVACEARAIALERFRALGVPDKQIPGALKALALWSPLFLQLKNGRQRGKGRLTVWPLDKEAFAAHERPWKGAANMGRNFWGSATSRSSEDWAEQLVTGHGRGLAYAGSTCLGTPLAVLLDGARCVVRGTLDELALPAFGGGQLPWVAPIAPTFDFAFIDRRSIGDAFADSRAADMTAHHCDGHSTMALPVARAWRQHLGEADHLPHGGTVLLGLAIADGLTYSPDVRCAWDDLRRTQGTADAAYFTVRRDGGQSFDLPLQPPTRTALDLAGRLPPWQKAEEALHTWLSSRWPSISWPKRPGGVMAAVCWIAARWVRLNQVPLLVEAYRPEHNAATFDALSNRRLKTGGAPLPLGGAELRQLLRPTTRRFRGDGLSVLQQLLRQHGRISVSKLRLGGHERRAKVLLRWFGHVFQIDTLRPVSAMVLRWLIAECEHWAPPRPGRDKPASVYKYLQRLLAALERLPDDTDPTTFGPAEWRLFGAAMLDTSDVPDEADRPRVFKERRAALGRMTRVLQSLPLYALARHAVKGLDIPDGMPRRAASAARVLVRPIDLDVSSAALHLVYADASLEALRAEARLRLGLDLRARAEEVNALELADLAEDGSFMAVDTVGFTHLKTKRSRRFDELRESTRRVALKLRKELRELGSRPRLFFSDVDGVENLRHGYQQQVVVDAVVRGVIRHPGFDPHALRGTGLMQGLCEGWDDHVIAMLGGPFELVHARAIVDGLAGASPAHAAGQLNTSGHASHKVPVEDYLTAWPWWYAAGMRVTLADVRLTPPLAARIPGCSEGSLAKWRFDSGQRGPLDEWCWAVRRHYPGWKWRPTQLAAPNPSPSPSPPVSHRALVRAPTEPVKRQLHYLVLRQLDLSVTGARGGARLGDGASTALEPLLLLLPTFAEVHDAGNPDPSDRPCRSAAALLADPQGQSLFNHLLAAPAVPVQLLLQMLRGTAPPCTEARVRSALLCLPQAQGLEIAFGPGEPGDSLRQAFEGSRRAQVITLSRAPRPFPRVRVIDAEHHPINQCQTALLAALTRLILESIHQLRQGV